VADNLVEILIGAKDTATPDLDALKARLDELGRKVETAKVAVDGDKDAEARLLRLNAQLENLNRRVANPKIKLDGIAKAGADILALDVGLDKLQEKASESSLQTGLVNAFGAIDGALSGLGGTIGAVLIPLGALVAILAGPLIAALLPITIGFGVLAAVAIPEISKVMKAVESGGAALKKLSGGERELVDPLRDLREGFRQLTKAVQPEIVNAFGTALKILKDVMPALRPLVVAAGKALDEFLGKVDSWLKSGSGQKFLKWLAVDGPKDIATFGHALWDTAQFVGRTFTFLKNAGDSWYTNVRNGLHTIEGAVDTWREEFVQMGHNVEATWDAIKGAFSSGYSFIAGIASKIEGVLGGLGSSVGGLPGKILGSLVSGLGFASGGVVGTAAAGGPRAGWTLVGEMGPELVRIPPGSQVLNNAATAAMFGGGGGGGNTYQISVNVAPGGNLADAGRQMVNAIREFERSSGTSWRT
jgi:phage-related protein